VSNRCGGVGGNLTHKTLPARPVNNFQRTRRNINAARVCERAHHKLLMTETPRAPNLFMVPRKVSARNFSLHKKNTSNIMKIEIKIYKI
jgi:hypothetical protein